MDEVWIPIVAGSVAIGVVFLALLACGVGWVVYTKHGCSERGNRCSSRFYLWPCIGMTACGQRFQKKGWWHEIDERVYVGAVPLRCLGHVRKFRKLGVTAVINLMYEYKGPTKEYAAADIEQLHLPVVDHYPPTLEQTEEGVDFVQKHWDAGGVVYIHCKGGHGRSAAIGFAWLLKHRKMTLEQAQVHIRSRRKVRKRLYRQSELIAYYRKHCGGAAHGKNGVGEEAEEAKESKASPQAEVEAKDLAAMDSKANDRKTEPEADTKVSPSNAAGTKMPRKRSQVMPLSSATPVSK